VVLPTQVVAEVVVLQVRHQQVLVVQELLLHATRVQQLKHQVETQLPLAVDT
jgi:hypothetical protein